MLKKFRKVTTLALVLAMILAVSASVFAADSFDETWYAPNPAIMVDASARIEESRTHGTISSGSNQGEVSIEYYYTYYLYYRDNPFTRETDYSSDNDYVHVDTGDMGAYTMKNAYYTFFAYVPTDDFGDSWYEPDTVELEFPDPAN